jgi:UDP-N-acetylglucosamine 2-epimerase (non-hydrolysing)
MSTHPRTLKKINQNTFPSNVKICQPFGLFDFIQLQKNAYCVISDSGTINEEAAILKIPAINFRLCTERPEVIDMGNIILSGLDFKNLLNAIKLTTSLENLNCPKEYQDVLVSDKILKIILSYTHVINSVIWKKN